VSLASTIVGPWSVIVTGCFNRHDSSSGVMTSMNRSFSRSTKYCPAGPRNITVTALNAALASLADGQARLDTGQTLTLDLRFTSIQKVSDDGERALIRPVNGGANASIYLLIARTNDRGVIVPEFEQEIGFEKIIGRADGAIPTIRIGDRWYLTEG
jgi:hypothetical protein